MSSCLYEGKAKRIYSTDDPDRFRIAYKDEATAFDGEKKAQIEGKGKLNNEISCLIFARLKEAGVTSHWVKRLSETEQLVERVEIIPLEVVVRNIAAGSLVRHLGFEKGRVLNSPIFEWYYKDDDLGDPLINEDHIRELGVASKQQCEQMRTQAIQVNQVLKEIFLSMGITLVDFKLEFGLNSEGKIVLADEISPDTCRLWDKETNEPFDKDLFRFQLGDLQTGYEEIYYRLQGGKQ
ncbi:phosphoribosylaminoimidazolesuccinocarboxamide synthase [Texcoconibacillus texcoconensis]|uniref:Phosphoribosylaminoimidazole-succinocarboxamide synthase n=1 Tax=Texcoconibacillus texcoconensis TaxID=1095777 RepID=A0A840QMG0_9BACI|nr:phosphoribosylaminoimidazolesuccinocarboxamide synthase [Texcoconibacillus texcoconensis]MBB5172564.1 phosphoribosylaminoimidazole-succinocarboxamide synthase [Texcoconibacillus texcoconensis]